VKKENVAMMYFLNKVVAVLGFSPVLCMAATLQVQVRDSSSQPIPDAVVYAEPEKPTVFPKPLGGVQIEQKSRKFSPLVSVIQTGSQVLFPNNDTVRHHIYSFSPAKKFEQKLYFGDAAPPVVFDKAGTVVLGCNIHDKMLAYIQIVDTPYFGKTDASGKVILGGIPNGKYTLKVWHYNSTSAGGVQELALQLKTEKQQAEFKLNLKPVVPDTSGSSDGY
jgi:plastocyanin